VRGIGGKVSTGDYTSISEDRRKWQGYFPGTEGLNSRKERVGKEEVEGHYRAGGVRGGVYCSNLYYSKSGE